METPDHKCLINRRWYDVIICYHGHACKQTQTIPEMYMHQTTILIICETTHNCSNCFVGQIDWLIVIIIISKFIKCHVCLQKAAEAVVRYRSDGLVTASKQECLQMSFKTMLQIAQHDFCRQTVPNDRWDVGEGTSCEISGQSRHRQ